MPAKEIIDRIERLVKQLALPVSVTNELNISLSNNYYNGVETIEKLINMNVVQVNPESLDFLKKYSFDLVKGMNEEIANKLRDTLSRDLMEGGGKRDLQKSIRKIFDTTEERARTIARTETNRAFSMGQFNAARNSPVKLYKYIITVPDDRRSLLCTRLASKYPKENAIPVTQKFVDDTTGESWLTTPFHPNERSVVVYTTKKIN
jgi:hypothetical protein